MLTLDLTSVSAVVTFTCLCGGQHETDFSGHECSGTTSVEWTCDDCGRRLRVYADIDVEVEPDPAPAAPDGGGA